MINYSFKEFFIAMGILTIIYLAFVLLRYYRKELNALIANKGTIPQQQDDDEIFGPFENNQPGEGEALPFSEDFKKAEIIIPKIKEIILQAGANNYDHLQLYDALKTVVTAYPKVNDPMIREGIAELIIHECKKHGAVKPDQREMDELWSMTSD